MTLAEMDAALKTARDLITVGVDDMQLMRADDCLRRVIQQLEVLEVREEKLLTREEWIAEFDLELRHGDYLRQEVRLAMECTGGVIYPKRAPSYEPPEYLEKFYEQLDAKKELGNE